ncbi:MAG: vWA domain-containing protein [Nannocystaceae bacterium]
MSQIRNPFVLGLTGLLLLGCGASPTADEAPAVRSESAPGAVAGSAAKAEPTASAPSAASDSADGSRASAPPPAADAPAYAAEHAEEAGASEMAGLGDAKADAGDDAYRYERIRQPPPPAAGRLTAGRWSDRDDWARWQQLLAPGSTYQSMLDSWSLGRLDRVAVSLRGHERMPADARLLLQDSQGRTLWQARADNQGRADLYLPAGTSGRLSVRAPDGRELASRQVSAGEQHELRVDQDVPVASALDIMFVVDTTGSMGDELAYLQTELTDIVGRVQRGTSQAMTVRTSVNFFRDHGDDYAVRSFPFTAELPLSLSQLRAEHASGGGDYPEALDAALADAVDGHQWSDSAVARIMFVVTDAPPHSGYDVGQRLQQTAARAAAKGIRIVPIASSGVDKPTEFVLRHLAVSTGGTYVFLTDHSGIGGGHIEPTVGSYVVQPLNDLLVEIIGEYTQTERLQLVAPSVAMAMAGPYPQGSDEVPCGYAMGRHGGHGMPWGWLALGLLVPAIVGGGWWLRSRRAVAPVSDARVARARRMVSELERRAGARPSEARSWAVQMREVVDGMEQLARQQQAIDASLRVAGAQPGEADPSGMRASLREEVAKRRAAIDAEIDAGLVSVDAAYLHVIGGVGERETALARLDGARETLQTRLEVERELRVGP